MRPNSTKDFENILLSLIPNQNGCLIWPRKANSAGYGYYKIRSNRILAHRLAWLSSGKNIPFNYCVMHKCDVPLCVNLAHLTVGTRSDNNRDRMNKNRSAIGEKAGRAKLTDKTVKKIREEYAKNLYTLKELSEQFGVSDHQIFQVAHRRSWRHIL